MRYVSYGGAPIAPDLVHAIKRGFPSAQVGNGFGLSETSSISTFLPHRVRRHARRLGRLRRRPVVDLDLADVDPATGVGELLIRGANVVQGYWNKPEATAETFSDGWLHTGDLARIDDEGFTYIVDRAKDMINRGGENVYCVEVENALAAAPGVFEVAVIGVPDEMMGEKVGAVVVPTPGTEFDVEAFLAYAARRSSPTSRCRSTSSVRSRRAAAQPRRQGAQAGAADRHRVGAVAAVTRAGDRSVPAAR